MPRYRALILTVLAVALLACSYIAFERYRIETAASGVEIAVDYSDLLALSRAYDYNPRAMLVAMRRAGLTSLAVSEELGASINGGREATLIGGQSLLDQARLGGVADPALKKLLATNAVDPDAVYITVFTNAAKARYLAQLHLHFSTRSIRVVRAKLPALIAVRTQLDYLSSLGLGLPAEPLRLARELGLLLVPRLQNDERFAAPQIQAEFAAFLAHERVSTVVFFGIRNQVLGFPDHVPDTATAFKSSHLNFGSIETYDATQVQKGNEELAKAIIGQTVRVQSISKVEQDKLDFETIVARFLLGARERNVRVLYLHPLLHQDGALSLQATNIELISRLSQGLTERGLHLGRATPVPAFRVNPLLIALASLAAPAVILLLLDLLGFALPYSLAGAAIVADLLLVAAGHAVHRDELVGKLIALCGAIGFAVLAVVVLSARFRTPQTPRSYFAALQAGLSTTLIGSAVALGGVLLVVALVSTPLTMEEIDRFTGVKAILLLPPLLVLTAYLFTNCFGPRPPASRALLDQPVRVYQLITATILLVAGVVYLARSGNQSDIAPTTFELALRSKLTLILSVRPRFKEFLFGFPALMVLPSLTAIHRRQFGWLLALAISIGLADSIDTFSHLHTPLAVSGLRMVNGLVIGVILGAIAIAVYRRRRVPAAIEVEA